jgi:hypothetical protein
VAEYALDIQFTMLTGANAIGRSYKTSYIDFSHPQSFKSETILSSGMAIPACNQNTRYWDKWTTQSQKPYGKSSPLNPTLNDCKIEAYSTKKKMMLKRA